MLKIDSIAVTYSFSNQRRRVYIWKIAVKIPSRKTHSWKSTCKTAVKIPSEKTHSGKYNLGFPGKILYWCAFQRIVQSIIFAIFIFTPDSASSEMRNIVSGTSDRLRHFLDYIHRILVTWAVSTYNNNKKRNAKMENNFHISCRNVTAVLV